MIDILLSTYNGAQYLKEQLDSLLNQTAKNWRLLVRDDGSSDDTLNILNQFIRDNPDKILLVDSGGQNVGLVKSYSRLLNTSTAEYVMLCDQDDIWLPAKIAISLQSMQNCEQLWRNIPILIHTDLIAVDKDLKIITTSVWKSEGWLVDLYSNNIYLLAVAPIVSGNTIMMNRHAVKASLPINPRCRYHDLWISLKVKCSGGVISNITIPTILYRRHSLAASVSAGNANLESAIFTLLRFSFIRSWKIEYQRAHLAGVNISITTFSFYKLKHLLLRYFIRSGELPRLSINS